LTIGNWRRQGILEPVRVGKRWVCATRAPDVKRLLKLDGLRDVPTSAAHLGFIISCTVDGVCWDLAAGEAAVVDPV
jgi:hypothetical protein